MTKRVNKISRIRKVTLIILIFTLIGYYGCKQIFTPEDHSYAAIDNNEKLLELTEGIFNYFNWRTWLIDDWRYLNFYGDDLTSNSKTYWRYYNDGNYFYEPSENLRANFDESWTESYKLIASINNIIQQYPNPQEESLQTKQLLGEAYFHRAWFYSMLTKIFGRIPIINNTKVSYTTPLSTFEEVYSFIESDLKIAQKLLPATRAECRIPYKTPNRLAAKAMLAEHYLSWAGYPIKDQLKYRLAAQVSGEIIDSTNLYELELLPDFVDLWNSEHLYNKESIYSFYYDISDKTHMYLSVARTQYSIYREYPYFRTSPTTGFRTDYISTEIDFYKNYPKSYRKEVTFHTTIYVDKTDNTKASYLGYVEVGYPSRAAYQKFYIDTSFTYTQMSSQGKITLVPCSKIYFLRYAQTLLTYAEAMARSGEVTPKAYECINKIRRRANKVPLDLPSKFDLLPGLAPSAFADSVFAERGWELAGENGDRWNSLIRMEKVEEVLDSRDRKDRPQLFSPRGKYKYYFDIPASEIIFNPSLGGENNN